jgi:hypothetical protein
MMNKLHQNNTNFCEKGPTLRGSAAKKSISKFSKKSTTQTIINLKNFPSDILGYLISKFLGPIATHTLRFVCKNLHSTVHHISILNKRYFDLYEIYHLAALNGYLKVLKWARENNFTWNKHTCVYAARGGHLKIGAKPRF